jgi:glycosyltransferase involved in cell wall biosynthesis
MELFEKGLVSIIIPVFNRETLLPETLDSILGQTYVNWECIIVDDGSTDASLNVAKGYAMKDNRFKVYRRPWYKKKGANSCRNYGFKLSNGEFIQWFDSDDLMYNSMLSQKIEFVNIRNSDILVCRASFFTDDVNNILIDRRTSIKPISSNPSFEYFAENFWFGTPQAFFRRQFLMNLNIKFNERLYRNQETVFFVELLLQNPIVHYIENDLILIRRHSNSIGGSYSFKSSRIKMQLDIPAYVILLNKFLKSEFYTLNVRLYFKNYFYQALKKCSLFSKSFWLVYLHLFVTNNLFSRFKLIKIFYNRIIR